MYDADGCHSRSGDRRFRLYLMVSVLIVCICMASLLVSQDADSADGDTFDEDGFIFTVISESKRTVVLIDCDNTREDLTIPSTVSKDGVTYTVTTIGEEAFCENDTIRHLTIPSSVKVIKRLAFEGCELLESVSFSEGLESLGMRAFAACPILRTFVLPSSFSDYGLSAFGECDSLMSIPVDEANPHFSNIDGALCSKDGSTLIAFPSGTKGTVTVPERVTAIGDFAFIYCNNIESVIIGPNVKSIGSLAFSNCSALKSMVLPATIEYMAEGVFSSCHGLETVVLEDGIGSISPWMFEKCDSLKSMTIPKSVKVIGQSAFQFCYSLTSITIGDGVEEIGAYAFDKCKGLISVTLPHSVKHIGMSAFAHCVSLSSISIPASVTRIEGSPFLGSSSLKCIIVDGNNENYVSFDGVLFDKGMTTLLAFPAAKEGDFDIPDSVVRIADFSFSDSVNLRSVSMGTNVTYIGFGAFQRCSSIKSLTILSDSELCIMNDAFLDCSKLTSLTIGGGVLSIGLAAFSNCKSLTTLVLKEGVTTIEMDAFLGCSGLTSITIPKSVKHIGVRAFFDCPNLTEIVVDGGNTVYSSIDGVLFDYDRTVLIHYPAKRAPDYNVPVSVTHIGPFAFSKSNLVSIVIGDNVVSIGDSAFEMCERLNFITMGNGVESIGDSAFAYCKVLGSINLSKALTIIGNYAFMECDSLSSIIVPENVETVGYSAFYGCGSLMTVSIPKSTLYIGPDVFLECLSLQSIDVDPDNPAYASVDGVLYDYDLTRLLCYPLMRGGVLNLPASVIEIDPDVLVGCLKVEWFQVEKGNVRYSSVDGVLYMDGHTLFAYPPLKEGPYIMPDTVKRVQYHAFDSCVGLTSIVLSPNVRMDDWNMFNSCPNLKEIILKEKNAHWISIDGVLYNKDGKTLSRVPEGRTEAVFLPADTVHIAIEAFYKSKVSEIFIVSGLSINCDFHAFHDCNPDIVFKSGRSGYDLLVYTDEKLTNLLDYKEIQEFEGNLYFRWMEIPGDDVDETSSGALSATLILTLVLLGGCLVLGAVVGRKP